ncbi:L-fucose:H+ symporter permease [Verrucomicrobiaceae bacterium N1E253]|uniref:L-fucose:H+ symporter permease n=1 Tax=Oceaniferula marina TaxID=2748318 RepID=A0A851GPX6_9BACT|nr:L-fucose:H+ symporter permease [Oceaniferula marina]NWK56204.1 L-fucose:H+ symporter permease [Oceaniferula marina]
MTHQKTPVVPKKHLLTFILLTSCFAAWGLANNMTDPLVKTFSRIFSMGPVQSAFVQFSFYGAYFCLALPAAFIIKKWSYKTGVLVGLGMFVIGAFLFYPASQLMAFNLFLISIFILAGGLSILETSCDPYILALGDEDTATQRLNLAQSFNPVGSLIGTGLAAAFILPNINPATDKERAAMPAEELTAIQQSELAAVMTPYIGMAFTLLLLWLIFAFMKMPKASKETSSFDLKGTFDRLLHNKHYTFGVIAQFFYVAAQICVWTFTIHYISAIYEHGNGAPLTRFLETSGLLGVVDHFGFDTQNFAGENMAGIYHFFALFIFLTFRFICTLLMKLIRPSIMLTTLALIAIALCVAVMASANLSSVLCLIGISACMSLMFPTIYGIALHGLGNDTKIGAAGLVMAILGGALFPLLQGYILKISSVPVSYIVPLACFIIVAFYGFFDLSTERKAHTDEPAAL